MLAQKYWVATASCSQWRQRSQQPAGNRRGDHRHVDAGKWPGRHRCAQSHQLRRSGSSVPADFRQQRHNRGRGRRHRHFPAPHALKPCYIPCMKSCTEILPTAGRLVVGRKILTRLPSGRDLRAAAAALALSGSWSRPQPDQVRVSRRRVMMHVIVGEYAVASWSCRIATPTWSAYAMMPPRLPAGLPEVKIIDVISTPGPANAVSWPS